MKYGGYYLLFFILIVFVIIFYYNMIQQNPYENHLQNLQQQQPHQHHQPVKNTKPLKYTNADDDHIKLYKDDTIYKKTGNINNYTYDIKDVDILKGNTSNNENKLGNKNRCLYEPELDEVYKTTLRGTVNDPDETIEIYDYSVKPNKTDLPIANAPLHLLMTNSPLRLSEKRHSV